MATPGSSAALSSESQAKLLAEALNVVKTQSHHLQAALDSHHLMDALKHASTLLAELRTSALTPKNYYELYMAVFDALRHISTYLKDAHLAKRHHIADVYELVQYAGNIVPRLYLMVTVGAVYLSIEGAPVRELLRDMGEMCRGVQHPTRGLFLRHYLSGMTRDRLPTAPSGGDESAGTLQDSIDFVLSNFVEMNKLWVRLQFQGHSRDRERREAERRELRILVGTNLVRLSQLDTITLPIYRRVVLPAILEQVINCKDVIAQEYLMEVIIQVFPDEFHLRTLDGFLRACVQLNPKVSVKSIVVALIERLVAYAAREGEALAEQRERELHEQAATPPVDGDTPAAQDDEASTPNAIPEELRLFDTFWQQVQEMFKLRPEITIQDVTTIMVALVNLALTCYPTELDYVDRIFAFVYDKAQLNADNPDLHTPETTKQLSALLRAPIQSYESVLTLLDIPSYEKLLSLQPFGTRRAVAHAVVASLLDNETLIESPEDASGVFTLCSVMVRDQKDATMKAGFGDAEEFIEEQGSLARMIHLLRSDSTDEQFLLLSTARRHLADGGAERIKHTFPSITYAALRLARRYHALAQDEGEEDGDSGMKCTALFRFLHQVVTVLNVKAEANELALQLFLACAQIADQCAFEEVAYDFFVQALTIYEESISESRAQFQALMLIVGALQSTRVFGVDNYETLVSKCVLHAGRLLKRPDQSRALALCSHLAWATPSSWRELPLMEVEVEVTAEAAGAAPPTTNGTHETDVDAEADVDAGAGASDASDTAHDATSQEASMEPKAPTTRIDMVPVPLHQDGRRVLETLQRALKIADTCLDPVQHVELFVEILNRYVYFFEVGVPDVTPMYINGLVDMVKGNLATMDAVSGLDKDMQGLSAATADASALYDPLADSAGKASLSEWVVRYFRATTGYLERRRQRAEQHGGDGRFSELDVQ